MSTISRLWESGRLPIHDGIYYGDGRSFEVVHDPTTDSGVRIGHEFDLDALLETGPDRVTSLDVTQIKDLPGAEGYVCCGEGSYGSEGFIAKMDAAKSLTWVMYLEFSNPFSEIELDENSVVFRSASGVSITANLRGSEF